MRLPTYFVRVARGLKRGRERWQLKRFGDAIGTMSTFMAIHGICTTGIPVVSWAAPAEGLAAQRGAMGQFMTV